MHEVPLEQRIEACPDCKSPLVFAYPVELDFLGSIDPALNSMWRYGALLPVDARVTCGEGNTPIVRLDDLSAELGIELYAMVETVNPTGTFKDREASFVVGRSVDLGDDNLVLQSTGNTAMAIAYYSERAGLGCFAFIPSLSEYKLWMPRDWDGSRGSNIISVHGTPQEVKDLAARFAKAHNFPKVSPFHERCEANVTLGLQVWEHVLRGQIPNPNFYLQVVSAGMGPIGFYEASKRMEGWAGITVPKIVCVQNAEFQPMNAAYHAGLETLEGVATPAYPSAEPFEPTLWTTNAGPYYPHLRRSMVETNGMFPVVEPEQTRSYEHELRGQMEKLGYGMSHTENAAFIAYAGLRALVEKGDIPRGSNVVMLVSGKGSDGLKKVEPNVTVDHTVEPEQLYRMLGG